VTLCCSFVLLLTETEKFVVFRLLRLRRLEWQRDGHLGEVAQVISWVEEGGAAAAAAAA
jgi:hypothetical protein